MLAGRYLSLKGRWAHLAMSGPPGNLYLASDLCIFLPRSSWKCTAGTYFCQTLLTHSTNVHFLSFKKEKKQNPKLWTNFYFSKQNIWQLPSTKLKGLLPEYSFPKPPFLSQCLFKKKSIFFPKIICVISYAMLITACLESFIQNENVSCFKSYFLLSENVADFCPYLGRVFCGGEAFPYLLAKISALW